MTTPFVNSVLARSFINKDVRIVGEVIDFESERATLRTSDGGKIAVKTRSGPMHYSKIVECTGRWTGAGVLEEHSHIDYSESFGMFVMLENLNSLRIVIDLNVHEQLLRLMHGPYKALFYANEA